MSDNIKKLEKVINNGEVLKNIQIVTFSYEDQIVDLTIKDGVISQAIIYKKDLSKCGWLSPEECKKLTTSLDRQSLGLFNLSLDILY